MKRLRSAGRRPRAGFTIVEVVLAMFILLIGMSTILGLLSFGAAMSRTASLRAGAANAIEAVLADLEERLFPLVLEEGMEVAGEPLPIERREIPGHPGLVYSAQPFVNPNNPLEYRVDVELSWSAAGARRSRKFTTLLLREVPFGERLRRRLVEGLEPQPASEVEAVQQQP